MEKFYISVRDIVPCNVEHYCCNYFIWCFYLHAVVSGCELHTVKIILDSGGWDKAYGWLHNNSGPGVCLCGVSDRAFSSVLNGRTFY